VQVVVLEEATTGSSLFKGALRLLGTLIIGAVGMGIFYFVILCNGLDHANHPQKARRHWPLPVLVPLHCSAPLIAYASLSLKEAAEISCCQRGMHAISNPNWLCLQAWPTCWLASKLSTHGLWAAAMPFEVLNCVQPTNAGLQRPLRSSF
jgi:hypothetical protein